jgi:3-oxoacyl-[acyl-carrier protein] reductase
VITGAGSGIGRATATRFASEGASVVVNDVDSVSADETVAEISRSGGVAAAHAGDVRGSGYIEALVGFAVERYGRLDVMHNNVGYGLDDGAADLTDAGLDEVIRANLYATVYGTRAALRIMTVQRAGVIINTASTAGIGAAARRSSYSMAKAAVISLTKSTAVDYGRFGVRANAICPGPVYTPAFGRFAPDLDYYASQTPMKRLGRAEEIAALALFLASDESSYVSGVAIPIDGAMTARLPAPFLTPADVTA